MDLHRAEGAAEAAPSARGGGESRGDRVFRSLSTAAGLSLLLLALAMLWILVGSSYESLKRFGFGFLMSQDWNPYTEKFGSLAFVFGTLASSLMAFAIAGPLGIGIALLLTELAPRRLRSVLSFLVELLAAVPSVVFGLWGMFVLAPLMRQIFDPFLIAHFGPPFFAPPSTGLSMLSTGVVLAVMILPTIMALSREVFDAVPSSARESALALGATRWEAISLAVLKPTRAGVVGALLLGLGRALGETMAVTMVIGNRPEVSANLLGPSTSMASVIANEFSEAVSDIHLAALAEIGLLLFAVTVALNLLARLLVFWTTARYSAGGKP